MIVLVQQYRIWPMKEPLILVRSKLFSPFQKQVRLRGPKYMLHLTTHWQDSPVFFQVITLDFFPAKKSITKRILGSYSWNTPTFSLLRNSNSFEWTVFLESHCLVGSQALSLQMKMKAPHVCVCVCVCVCINSAFGFHCDYLANARYKNSLGFPDDQVIRKAWRVYIQGKTSLRSFICGSVHLI